MILALIYFVSQAPSRRGQTNPAARPLSAHKATFIYYTHNISISLLKSAEVSSILLYFYINLLLFHATSSENKLSEQRNFAGVYSIEVANSCMVPLKPRQSAGAGSKYLAGSQRFVGWNIGESPLRMRKQMFGLELNRSHAMIGSRMELPGGMA